jgi:hypothetical protein
VGVRVPRRPLPEERRLEALEKAEELGRSIRNHEHAYAAFEGAPPTELNGGDGWDITIEGGAGVLPGSDTADDPVRARDLRGRPDAVDGARHQLGDGCAGDSPGAGRAVLRVPRGVRGDLASARQRQVLRRFVDVNFGTEYATPS